MQQIPIDSSRLPQMTFLRVTPKIADRNSNAQKKNSQDVPLWAVQVLLTDQDRKAELEEIAIPAHIEPVIAPMTPVLFENLRAFFWSMNGRAGISLSADSMKAGDDLSDLFHA